MNFALTGHISLLTPRLAVLDWMSSLHLSSAFSKDLWLSPLFHSASIDETRGTSSILPSRCPSSATLYNWFVIKNTPNWIFIICLAFHNSCPMFIVQYRLTNYHQDQEICCILQILHLFYKMRSCLCLRYPVDFGTNNSFRSKTQLIRLRWFIIFAFIRFRPFARKQIFWPR